MSFHSPTCMLTVRWLATPSYLPWKPCVIGVVVALVSVRRHQSLQWFTHKHKLVILLKQRLSSRDTVVHRPLYELVGFPRIMNVFHSRYIIAGKPEQSKFPTGAGNFWCGTVRILAFVAHEIPVPHNVFSFRRHESEPTASYLYSIFAVFRNVRMLDTRMSQRQLRRTNVYNKQSIEI